MKIKNLIRQVHVYAGFAMFLPLLLFAVSGFMLNHRWPLWETWNERREVQEQVSVEVPADGTALEKARSVLGQLGLAGEVSTVVLEPQEDSLQVRAQRPGQIVQLDLMLSSGRGTLKRTQLDGWFVVRNLHTLTGLHSNLQEKKNWTWTRAWSLVMDFSAVIMVLLAATGLYLWTVSEERRWAGLTVLALGALAFAAVVLLLVGI
ncbi:PepSY-associated TM helix domain-containing protein [Gemmatimonadota bacterium]